MAKGQREQGGRVLCCSKKIVLASHAVTVLLTLATVLGVFLAPAETNLAPLEVVTGLAWAETTASNAFYYWKAKNENRIKLTEKMVADLADKYGIDAVVNLAGLVIKD